MKTIVFRADFNSKVGAGHFTRCLALAQELKRHRFKITFVMKASPMAKPLLKEGGISFYNLGSRITQAQDLKRTQAIVCSTGAAAVIIDHYRADARYMTALRKSTKVIAMSDLPTMRFYPCDMLINHNIYAAKLRYNCARGAKQLKGPRYTILRLEFRKNLRLKRDAGRKARHALVTFGATEQPNLIPAVERILSSKGIHADVTGLKSFQSASEMAALMRKADIALATPSVTFCELIASRVPTILVQVAGNQQGIADYAAHKKLALFAGKAEGVTEARLTGLVDRLVNDAALRKSLAKNMAGIIDGKGAERILKEISFLIRI